MNLWDKKEVEVFKPKHIYEARRKLKELKWSEDKFLFYGVRVPHWFIRDVNYVQKSLDKGILPQTDCVR